MKWLRRNVTLPMVIFAVITAFWITLAVITP